MLTFVYIGSDDEDEDDDDEAINQSNFLKIAHTVRETERVRAGAQVGRPFMGGGRGGGWGPGVIAVLGIGQKSKTVETIDSQY